MAYGLKACSCHPLIVNLNYDLFVNDTFRWSVLRHAIESIKNNRNGHAKIYLSVLKVDVSKCSSLLKRWDKKRGLHCLLRDRFDAGTQ